MGEVTETIRALLGEGLTSGEIIARGFRPGTVYKVQRSVRLATSMAESGMDEPGAVLAWPGREADGASVLADRMDDAEAILDNVSLRLDAQERRASAQREALTGEIERLQHRSQDQERQLHELRTEIERCQRRTEEQERQLQGLQGEAGWLRSAVHDIITLLAEQDVKPRGTLGGIVRRQDAIDRIRRRLRELDPHAAQRLLSD